MTSKVWTPLKIGHLTVRHRLCLPAHFALHIPTPEYAGYLRERARGGASMVFTLGPNTHPSATVPYLVDGFRRDWVDGFKVVVDAVHSADTPIIVQMAHIGNCGLPPQWTLDTWGPLWGASALRSPNQWVIPKALEADDIKDFQRTFVESCVITQDTGADGVEFHAAHGYLLSSFISPLWNRRTDEYGGNTENRVRLLKELYEETRARCGDQFVIGLKLSVEEYHGKEGLTPDEGVQILNAISDVGFDYYNIAHADYHNFHRLIAPMSSGITAPLVDATRKMKAAAGDTPILMHGMLQTVELAERLVNEGLADMVGLVRPQIADPHIINKTREGRIDEIRRCVGQNQGCIRRVGMGVSCTSNPTTGREIHLEGKLEPTKGVKKHVLVIGGGPGGMKAAETAAITGHRVTLLEKSVVLGGQVRDAARLPNYENWRNLTDDLEGQLKRLGVDIRLNTEADVESVMAMNADKIIVATGSTWDKSGFAAMHVPTDPIPPELDTQVLDPIEVINAPEKCGHHVLVIDDVGDYTPMGIARMLAERGHHVSIVTSDHQVGRKLHPKNEFEWLYPRTLQVGVEIYTSSVVQYANEECALARNLATNDVAEIEANTIVTCMLRKANESLFLDLKAAGADVERIGDCLAPREVDDAVLEGFRAALEYSESLRAGAQEKVTEAV